MTGSTEVRVADTRFTRESNKELGILAEKMRISFSKWALDNNYCLEFIINVSEPTKILTVRLSEKFDNNVSEDIGYIQENSCGEA